jgi:hypothetical protein
MFAWERLKPNNFHKPNLGDVKMPKDAHAGVAVPIICWLYWKNGNFVQAIRNFAARCSSKAENNYQPCIRAEIVARISIKDRT